MSLEAFIRVLVISTALAFGAINAGLAALYFAIDTRTLLATLASSAGFTSALINYLILTKRIK